MGKWISLLLISFLICGCALVSNHHKGQRALNREEYDAAIMLFEEALRNSPSNPGILTDLGVAYFRKGDLGKSAEYLKRAKSADPQHGRAYLYMGMVYEKQDDLPQAISEYNTYYRRSPFTPMGLKLKARMGVLMRKQITREIQAAIQNEESLSVDSVPPNTIAVSYFSNHTGKEEYDVLQKGLADMLITDLSQAKSLKVLERERMQVLIDELKLGETGLIDASTTPRLGRLLGARRIVNGTIALPQAGMLRIDALAVDVATSQSDAEAYAMGDQERFFLMEKELVFDILDDLKVTLTQEERDAIQKLPTESFLAFLAYCRGLDYEDRGMYQQAAQQYKDAAKIDPGFSQAKEKAGEIQTLADSPMTGSSDETAQWEQMVPIVVPPADEQFGISSGDRLANTLRNTSGGFLPSPDDDGQTDDRNPPQQQTRTTIDITVELQ